MISILPQINLSLSKQNATREHFNHRFLVSISNVHSQFSLIPLPHSIGKFNSKFHMKKKKRKKQLNAYTHKIRSKTNQSREMNFSLFKHKTIYYWIKTRNHLVFPFHYTVVAHELECSRNWIIAVAYCTR